MIIIPSFLLLLWLIMTDNARQLITIIREITDGFNVNRCVMFLLFKILCSVKLILWSPKKTFRAEKSTSCDKCL